MIQETFEKVNDINEFSQLYSLLDQQDSLSDQAVCLLQLRNVYISLCDFDPLTHEPMPESFSQLLSSLSNVLHNDLPSLAQNQDRFTRIIQQCYQAINAIIKHPKTRVIREHELIPISQVKEVDNASVHWLSRQSGRNLREKLSGKNQMLAVKRRMSFNSAENRLVKACLKQIEELLLLRLETDAIAQYTIPEDHEVLLQKVQAWLRDENTQEIRRWENLPPNNVLLNDRNYRKIWDSWQHLKQLDDNSLRDWFEIEKDFLTAVWWATIALLKESNQVIFLDLPCEFNYDQFSIKTTQDIKAQVISKAQASNIDFSKVNKNQFSILTDKHEFIIKVYNSKLLIVKNTAEVNSFPLSVTVLKEIAQEIATQIINFPESASVKFNNIETEAAFLEINSFKTVIKPLSQQLTPLPLRFLTQIWSELKESKQLFVLDASESQALRAEYPIISCRHLWQEKNDPQVRLAIDSYVDRLQKFLQTKNLIYLVPDHVSEFATENLRHKLNFAYANATALPKSIAALIGWQMTSAFDSVKIENDDLFFILDNSETEVFITPVQARFSAHLLQKMPKTRGFCWERHPSFSIEGSTDKEMIFDALKNQHSEDNALSEIVSDIFHFDEIYDVAEPFALLNGEHWYHLPADLKERLKTTKIKQRLNKNDVINEIKYFNKEISQVRLISITATIDCPDWILRENWLACNNLLIAAENLYQWQYQAPDAIFWRDHLPKLSTATIVDNYYQDFYFVNDAPPVQPKRGQITHIPIKEYFTLTEGRPFYEFPLKIGNKAETKYVARLDSSVFPLADNILCRLELTYEYGADQPYQLKFIPKDENYLAKAKFKALFAKWLPNTEKKEGIAPSYPTIYRWDSFEAYDDRNNKQPTNLYEWLKKDFVKIKQCCQFLLTGSSKTRITINISGADWFTDKNGNYCAKFYDPKYGNLFLHQSNFESFSTNITKISCSLPRNEKVFDITKAGSLPKEFEALKKLFPMSSYRFPMLTIWNNGNSLSDLQVPTNFRDLVFETVQLIGQVLENKQIVEAIPKSIKNELRQLCSYMHKDTAKVVIDWMLNKTSVVAAFEKQNVCNKIAYALGDLTTNWQQQLIVNILTALKDNKKARPEILVLLSIACWRNENFIHYFTEDDLKLIIKITFKSMVKDIDYLTENSQDWHFSSLLRRLELLLALLRTRGSENHNIKSIFDLDSKTISKFIRLLNEIEAKHSMVLQLKLLDKNARVQSRVKFNDFNKPDNFKHTPDILYALRLYLTGDDGANLISITGVTD